MNRILASLAVAACIPAQAQWVYQASEDEMSGKVMTTATAVSVNQLDLPFPYDGANHGYLSVRNSPLGLQVIYSVDKGQVLCPSRAGCHVTVRFDDDKPTRFSARPANDRSPEFVFLSDQRRFTARAKTAKTIRVQADMYRAGAPVTKFHTPEGLEWPPKAQP